MSKDASSRGPDQVITFGEMVAAAFDHAELVTGDPGAAADLATRTVGRWLARTGRPDIADLARRQPARRSASRPSPRRYPRAA